MSEQIQWLAPPTGLVAVEPPVRGAAPSKPNGVELRPGERPLVLVVEDDPPLQDMMAEYLGRRFEVGKASDYRSALHWLETHAPAAACIDLCLPNESGYQLVEHFRRTPALAHVPILVTSGRGLPGDMVHAEEAGANAFVRKPFALRALLATVEQLVGS